MDWLTTEIKLQSILHHSQTHNNESHMCMNLTPTGAHTCSRHADTPTTFLSLLKSWVELIWVVLFRRVIKNGYYKRHRNITAWMPTVCCCSRPPAIDQIQHGGTIQGCGTYGRHADSPLPGLDRSWRRLEKMERWMEAGERICWRISLIYDFRSTFKLIS